MYLGRAGRRRISPELRCRGGGGGGARYIHQERTSGSPLAIATSALDPCDVLFHVTLQDKNLRCQTPHRARRPHPSLSLPRHVSSSPLVLCTPPPLLLRLEQGARLPSILAAPPPPSRRPSILATPPPPSVVGKGDWLGFSCHRRNGWRAVRRVARRLSLSSYHKTSRPRSSPPIRY